MHTGMWRAALSVKAGWAAWNNFVWRLYVCTWPIPCHEESLAGDEYHPLELSTIARDRVGAWLSSPRRSSPLPADIPRIGRGTAFHTSRAWGPWERSSVASDGQGMCIGHTGDAQGIPQVQLRVQHALHAASAIALHSAAHAAGS